jgi:hypothetical protein
VTPDQINGLILAAALDFGPDYYYEIKNGTLGPTLYIDAGTKFEASHIRTRAPGSWRGLYVIVLYTSNSDDIPMKEIQQPQIFEELFPTKKIKE